MPILKDEEILIAYFEPTESRSGRQLAASHQFAFECLCDLCSGPANPASDIRRERIAELDDRIYETTSRGNALIGFKLAKERLRLLDEERLPYDKSRTLYDSFQACVLASDFTTAKKQIGLAYGASALSEGIDAEPLINYRSFYLAPTTHRNAGLGLKKKMPMICDTCGSTAKVVCKACSCAVYCDTVSQKEHAKSHKPICRVIQQFDKKEGESQ